MATEWAYFANLVAVTPEIGNRLMVLLAEDVGDATAFNEAVPLVDTNGAPTTARLLALPMRVANHDILHEILAGGDCPLALGAGATEQDIIDIRAGVHGQCGTREDIAPQWQAFITSLGYALP
jgi:hypothetical protein